MLRSGEEIHAHVVRQRQILRAVRNRVNERCRARATPVLNAGVRIEDFRLMITGTHVVERAFLDARDRIALPGICEWK